jgi:hypothetical protein
MTIDEEFKDEKIIEKVESQNNELVQNSESTETSLSAKTLVIYENSQYLSYIAAKKEF